MFVKMQSFAHHLFRCGSRNKNFSMQIFAQRLKTCKGLQALLSHIDLRGLNVDLNS